MPAAAMEKELSAELTAAGIEVHDFGPTMKDHCKAEVKTSIVGGLHGWHFKRARRYWIAEGPGLPPAYATPFFTSRTATRSGWTDTAAAHRRLSGTKASRPATTMWTPPLGSPLWPRRSAAAAQTPCASARCNPRFRWPFTVLRTDTGSRFDRALFAKELLQKSVRLSRQLKRSPLQRPRLGQLCPTLGARRTQQQQWQQQTGRHTASRASNCFLIDTLHRWIGTSRAFRLNDIPRKSDVA
jgi:hypothetical protein